MISAVRTCPKNTGIVSVGAMGKQKFIATARNQPQIDGDILASRSRVLPVKPNAQYLPRLEAQLIQRRASQRDVRAEIYCNRHIGEATNCVATNENVRLPTGLVV